jgi:hypothetical protein
MTRKRKIKNRFSKGALTFSLWCNSANQNIKCKVCNGILTSYIPKFIGGKPVTEKRRKMIVREISIRVGRYNEKGC